MWQQRCYLQIFFLMYSGIFILIECSFSWSVSINRFHYQKPLPVYIVFFKREFAFIFFIVFEFLFSKRSYKEFPGAFMVRTPCFHCRGHGCVPGLETKIWDPVCCAMRPSKTFEKPSKESYSHSFPSPTFVAASISLSKDV